MEKQLIKELKNLGNKVLEKQKGKKEFKKKFDLLKTKVFKPFVNEASKIECISLLFFSDDTSNLPEHKNRNFFRIVYINNDTKNQNLGRSSIHLNIEGRPENSTILLSQRVAPDTNTIIENVAEYSIDSVKKDMLENHIMDFLRIVLN